MMFPRRFLALCLLLLASFGVWAQQALPVPKLTQYVTDQAGIIEPATRDALEAKLRALDEQGGSQLVVLTIPTLGGEALEDYSIRVAESNQVGRKKLSDGVLLLVVPNDRKARIEVGYGLEGAIPDATAVRVIQEYMAPKFRTGDYGGGINDAVDALTTLIKGEQLPAPVVAEHRGAQGGGNWLFALIAAFFVAQFARAIFGALPAGIRGILGGVGAGGVALLISSALLIGGIGALMGFLFGLAGSGGGGRFARQNDWGSWGGGGWGGGGFGGGGWGGGGGGGGGFSGGGGSFGGGGASGSW